MNFPKRITQHIKHIRHIFPSIPSPAAFCGLFALLLLFTGCFTGVESTPKITYKEVKRQKADATEEQRLAATFRAQPFAQWEAGKRFFVSSPRASMAFTPVSVATLRRPLKQGDELTYFATRQVPSVAGGPTAEMLFLTADADTLRYRPESSVERLEERQNLEVPFLTELSVVEQMRNTLKGNTYYIKTSLWYDAAGSPFQGLKYVPVIVTDVTPANETYQARVSFTEAQPESSTPRQAYVYMTPAADPDKRSPRGFDTLFSFRDIRKQYPQITPENWDNIVHSRLALGMTRDEATLSIGSPRTIDRGHDQSSAYERWGYGDGVYLIFQDGILERFNR